MSQKRYFDFYSDLTDEGMNTQQKSIVGAGRLFGLTPTVTGPNTIELSPGAVITPSGIVIFEDSTVTLPPAATPIPGVAAWKYTIVLQHINVEMVGGSAATWVAIDDPTYFYTQEASAHQVADDQTIVFWLNYPGGSIALADYMIVPASPLRDERNAVHQNTLQPIALVTEWHYDLAGGVLQRLLRWTDVLMNEIYVPVATPGGPWSSSLSIAMFNHEGKSRIPYAFRTYAFVGSVSRMRLHIFANGLQHTSAWIGPTGASVFDFDMLNATPSIITNTWAPGPYVAALEFEHGAADQVIALAYLQPLNIG